MGVPKFFRWMSERYPKINQRVAFLPKDETYQKHFDSGSPPEPLEEPDPMSLVSKPPPIDRLYIDVNGILHGCSHNNNMDDGIPRRRVTHEEIFTNVCYYLDRIISDMVKPTELVYLAIDGVAPRAKLNQQRSRRYRSGQDGEIERSVYEAHMTKEEKEAVFSNKKNSRDIQEVAPGRFTGTFEAHDEEANNDSSPTTDEKGPFRSNAITPGTPFFSECTEHLQHFIKHKLSTDPKWQHLTIIFSGPNVPGEGEHKIMDFIRQEQRSENYSPSLRHCIMGQDGDLIMLGLATHERNLVLLREEVIFEMRRRKRLAAANSDATHPALSAYIHNHSFEFLHMSVLRDYLSYEFETQNVYPQNPWDIERTIDDFVFLTFFVGNDFLPHMPALDIADEAFDLLFYTYKKKRTQWGNKKRKGEPYLTDAGTIVSGKRLQRYLEAVGEHETAYYDNKKLWADRDNERWRKADRRANLEPTIPSDAVLHAKEQADRAEYREMLESAVPDKQTSTSFAPVLSHKLKVKKEFVPEPEQAQDGLLTRMSKLLSFSASTKDTVAVGGNDQDLKGRYYFGKFQFTPYDAEKHVALRKAYIEGLVWNLKYYYEGCVSWDWYYPYHYGPMLSDLVDIDKMLEDISFDELGEPLLPYQQLMGCMPPSSAYLLPKPYRWLLTEESSPIVDFYPRSFTVDMNGKRWEWEAVVLLPFIDSDRLVDAARKFVTDDMLSEEERQRNMVGKAVVFSHDAHYVEPNIPGVGKQGRSYFEAIEECTAKTQLLEDTVWDKKPQLKDGLSPKRETISITPQGGFPTLQDAPIQTLSRRKIRINVFGLKSRYVTAALHMADNKPPLPPLSVLGPEFVGTTVFIGYPYLTEGFVTAVSDAEMTVRGKNPPRLWTQDEQTRFLSTKNVVLRKGMHGEGFPGSGGWKIPESTIMFSVRPLQDVEYLPDGSPVKVFAKFEVEVPIDAALLTPTNQNPELASIPARLENDPFFLNTETNGESNNVPGDGVNGVSLVSVDGPSPAQPAIEATGPPATSPPNGNTKREPAIIPYKEIVAGMDAEQFAREIEPTQSQEASAQAKSLSVDVAIESPKPTPAFLPEPQKLSSSLPQAGGPLLRDSLPRKKTDSINQRKFSSVSRSVRATFGRSRSNARGRILAIGVAAAVTFFGKGSSEILPSPRMRLASVPNPIFLNIRGGSDGAADPYRGKNDEGAKSPPPLEFEHGTTTLSFIFEGGIIAAVDSRASIGNFIGSKTTQKVLPINDHMLGTMAGGAADCSFWIRRLKAEAMLHELTEGRRMSVARASRMLSNALYQNRGLELSVGTMIMGFDQDGGPSIFYVDNTGVRIGGDLFSVGSGSTFALGILDTERRYDMTEDEAIALGIKAIRHATFRDAYSGGFIGVYLITKDGWKKVFSEDLALSAEHMLKEARDSPSVEDA